MKPPVSKEQRENNKLTTSPPAPCRLWLVQRADSLGSLLCQSASYKMTGDNKIYELEWWSPQVIHHLQCLLARACVSWRSGYGIRALSLSSLVIRILALNYQFNFIPGQLLLQFPSSGYSSANMKEGCLVSTGQEAASEKSLLLYVSIGPLGSNLEEVLHRHEGWTGL